MAPVMLGGDMLTILTQFPSIMCADGLGPQARRKLWKVLMVRGA